MSRVKSSLQSVFILAIIFSLLIQTVPVFSQAIIQKVVITSVDYSQFPNISAKVRVTSEDRIPVTKLNEGDITVTEDGQPVDFSYQSVKVGTKVMIIMDLGGGLQYDGITRTSKFEEMRSIVNGFLNTMDENDGVELILVYEHSTTVPVKLTNDRNALLDAVAKLEYQATDQLSNGLDGVKRAMDDFEITTGDITSTSILLITPGIQSIYSGAETTYSEIESLLEAKDIPIHTVMVGSCPSTSTLQDLVVHKSKAELVCYSSKGATDSLFNLIEAQRWQYEISYRSKSSSGKERELKISARTESGTPPFDVERFTVVPEPQAPAVLSMLINNGDPVTRTAPAHDSKLSDIPLTESPIDVQIYWPDSYSQRTITRAELFVDSQPHDEPFLELEGVENVSFTWNLRGYTNAGKTTARVQVVLTDELGLQSIEEIQVPVTVITKDPPTPTPVVSSGPCDSITNETVREMCVRGVQFGFTPAQLVNMVIALAALILVIFLILKRDTVKDVVIGSLDKVRETIKVLRSEPKAFLEVVSGLPPEERKKLDLYGETPIGRNREYSKLIFENPMVSELHCTLHLEGHRWTIEDQDSANGTFLNGRKLTPLSYTPLNDEDIIELAPVERGGIRFKFTLAKGVDFENYGDMEEKSFEPPEPDVRITEPVETQQPFYSDEDDDIFDRSQKPFG